MTQIIKIEKCGNIKCENIKEFDELYKKCGFRKIEGFEKITDWNREIEGDNVNVELWGKVYGKGTVKNTYNFPESVEKKVYGNCSLVRKNNDAYVDMDEATWDKMCDSLINGVKNMTVDTESVVAAVAAAVDSDTESDNDYDEDDEINSLVDSELKEESYIYSSEDEEK